MTRDRDGDPLALELPLSVVSISVNVARLDTVDNSTLRVDRNDTVLVYVDRILDEVQIVAVGEDDLETLPVFVTNAVDCEETLATSLPLREFREETVRNEERVNIDERDCERLFVGVADNDESGDSETDEVSELVSVDSLDAAAERDDDNEAAAVNVLDEVKVNIVDALVEPVIDTVPVVVPVPTPLFV